MVIISQLKQLKPTVKHIMVLGLRFTVNQIANIGMLAKHHFSVHSSIENGRYGHSNELDMTAHVALRMFAPLSQPVDCIFWPKRTLNAVNCMKTRRKIAHC